MKIIITKVFLYLKLYCDSQFLAFEQQQPPSPSLGLVFQDTYALLITSLP